MEMGFMLCVAPIMKVLIYCVISNRNKQPFVVYECVCMWYYASNV